MLCIVIRICTAHISFPSPFIFIFAGGVWKLVSIILTIGNEKVGKAVGLEEVKVKIREDFTVGEISSRLFASFVEHMGSVAHTGIYEPAMKQLMVTGLDKMSSLM